MSRARRPRQRDRGELDVRSRSPARYRRPSHQPAVHVDIASSSLAPRTDSRLAPSRSLARAPLLARAAGRRPRPPVRTRASARRGLKVAPRQPATSRDANLLLEPIKSSSARQLGFSSIPTHGWRSVAGDPRARTRIGDGRLATRRGRPGRGTLAADSRNSTTSASRRAQVVDRPARGVRARPNVAVSMLTWSNRSAPRAPKARHSRRGCRRGEVRSFESATRAEPGTRSARIRSGSASPSQRVVGDLPQNMSEGIPLRRAAAVHEVHYDRTATPPDPRKIGVGTHHVPAADAAGREVLEQRVIECPRGIKSP